jgi:hypothetical protein
MANTNCASVLLSYADFLNNNPNSDFPRPHVLLFSEPNCGGSVWPDFRTVPIEGFLLSPPFAPKLGSLYMPANWQLQLFETDIKSNTRLICSSFQPTLVTDTKSFNFNNPNLLPDCSTTAYPPVSTISVKDDVRNVIMNSVVPLALQDYTTTCWKFDMCNSLITTNIGAQNLTSFAQGSLECDDLMTDFCNLDTGYTCRQNKQAGNNFVLPECSCLQDEKTINAAFCQPGNTAQECQEAGAFQEFIPVTCFGKNCTLQGYRFSRMLHQRCNVTLCQQVIDVIGTNLSVDTNAILYCGTRPEPTITPVPHVATQTEPQTIPGWGWLLIVSGILVFLVLLPLAIYIHRRSEQEQKEDAELALSAETPLVVQEYTPVTNDVYSYPSFDF